MAIRQATFSFMINTWGQLLPLFSVQIKRIIQIISILLMVVLVPSLHAQSSQVITSANADQLTLMQTFTGHDLAVNDLVFSPDGSQLLSAGSDITARIWDVAAGSQQYQLDGQLIEVRSIDISPDGRTAVTTGFNNAAYLWDIPTQTRGQSFRWPAAFSDGQFSPDGDAVAFAIGDGSVQVYDLSGELTQTLTVQTETLLVETVSYHPAGTLIAAGTGFPGDEVVVWDADIGSVVWSATEHVGTVYGVAFSPDGDFLASCDASGKIILWENTTGDIVSRIDSETSSELFDIAYSPDGQLLATAGFDGVLHLWDANTGESITTLIPPVTDQSLLTVAFSPTGDLIAAAGEAGEIWLWGIGE